MAVTIGIEPHKGSARCSGTLTSTRRRWASYGFVPAPTSWRGLFEWAKAWPERTWAVENASGLGYLLAQQLVGAGEKVLDVPPSSPPGHACSTTATSTRTTPTTPALSPWPRCGPNACRRWQKRSHDAVMRLWARRRKELTRARTRVANRLHAVILELVPGGYAVEIYASKVARLLEAFEPAGAVAAARKEIAEERLGDLRRLDAQLAEIKQRLAAVVAAPAHHDDQDLRRPAGRGGHHRRPHRRRRSASPTRTTSPPTTALPRSRSPLGRKRSTACRCGAAAS